MARSIPSAARELLFIAALCALVPATARADAASNRARELFNQAQKAYDTGQFEEALKDYAAAYDAKPLPGFLFNIAQCHRQLGNDERAIFFYQRYLEKAGDGPAAETARKLLAECQARQAEKEQQARAEAEAKRQQELDASRAAAARAEAEAAEKRRAELVARQAFDARKQAEASANKTAAAPTEAVAAPADKPLVKKWWFWTAIGAAAVATVATVYVVTLPRAPEGTLGTIDAR